MKYFDGLKKYLYSLCLDGKESDGNGGTRRYIRPGFDGGTGGYVEVLTAGRPSIGTGFDVWAGR